MILATRGALVAKQPKSERRATVEEAYVKPPAPQQGVFESFLNQTLQTALEPLREQVRTLAEQLRGTPSPPTSEKKKIWLHVEDVAEQCGVTKATVRAWIGSGRLRAKKPGARYLILPRDLEAFIAAQKAEQQEADVDDSEAVRMLAGRIGGGTV